MPDGGEANNPVDNQFPETVAVDEACHLLSDGDRRAVLTYLTELSGETTTFQAIRDHLIECKIDGTGERPEPEQIGIKLQHVHLPKLADYGVIEYDARSETVRYRPADPLESFLAWIQAEAQTEESN